MNKTYYKIDYYEETAATTLEYSSTYWHWHWHWLRQRIKNRAKGQPVHEEVQFVASSNYLHLGLFVSHATGRRVADLTYDIARKQSRFKRNAVHRHLNSACTRRYC